MLNEQNERYAELIKEQTLIDNGIDFDKTLPENYDNYWDFRKNSGLDNYKASAKWIDFKLTKLRRR